MNAVVEAETLAFVQEHLDVLWEREGVVICVTELGFLPIIISIRVMYYASYIHP